MLKCLTCKSTNVSSWTRNNSTRIAYRCECGSQATPEVVDDEVCISENKRLTKSNQRGADLLRIKRKADRESNRFENALESFATAINDNIGVIASNIEIPSLKQPLRDNKNWSKEIGVIQITDWHLNEVVDLPDNSFDFNVASKRAKMLVNEAILTFKGRGISKVVLASTGDMLNSDRRMDELLSQATNRARATVVATQIITEVILDLSQYFDSVSVVNVLGNESRMDKEMTFGDFSFSNNLDYMTMAMAKKIVEAKAVDNVKFISIDKLEAVVNINGQNVLFMHDLTRATSNQKNMQALVGRYALKGVVIDYMMGGHIHSTNISDFSSRSASLVGSNPFGEKALGFASRASQNIAIFGEGYRRVIAVDLQDVPDTFEGYNYSDELTDGNMRVSRTDGEQNNVFEL